MIMHAQYHMIPQITPDNDNIYPEGLKVLILLADLANGILYESGNIAMTNAKTFGLVAFLFPGIIYLIGALVYIAFAVANTMKNLDESDDFNLQFKYIAKVLLISTSSLVGTIIYFVADNYYLVEQIKQDEFLNALNDTTSEIGIFIKINAIQPPFLVLAILFYHAIPKAIKTLFKESDSSNNEVSSKMSNSSNNKVPSETSNSSRDEDSIYVGIWNVAVITTDFDTWFTLIQTTGVCLYAQLSFVWVLLVFMSLTYCVVLVLGSLIGYYVSRKSNHYKEFDGVIGSLMIASLLIAFELYLLGDNRQPLDCYASLSDRSKSILRLLFLLLAFLSYFTVSVYFCSAFFTNFVTFFIDTRDKRPKLRLQIELDIFDEL